MAEVFVLIAKKSPQRNVIMKVSNFEKESSIKTHQQVGVNFSAILPARADP